MWTSSAFLADWFFNQPEIFATLVFAYFLLPFVIAPLAGTLAGLLVGGSRHLFACAGAGIAGCIAALVVMSTSCAGPVVGLRECFREMAAPAIFSTSAAIFVAALARRRI
jgi:hypothetical protein